MKLRSLLIICLVAACTLSASAEKKNKKNKKAPATELTITTQRDSLSYAAGASVTQGLQQFLKQQFGVDSVYYADFLEGYNEAVANAGDPKAAARAAGAQIASQVTKMMLPRAKETFKDTPDSLREDLFHKGFAAGLMGDASVMSVSEAAEYFGEHQHAVTEAKNKAWQKKNQDFLAENKTKEGVKTTPSGLQYKVLTQGTGAVPTKDQEVVVKYEGKLIDGTVFDSSYKRDPQTTTFKASQVIKGWTEALTMMPVGSKWELYIPQELGYGARQMGDKIKPYSVLIFTVELVSIKEENKK